MNCHSSVPGTLGFESPELKVCHPQRSVAKHNPRVPMVGYEGLESGLSNHWEHAYDNQYQAINNQETSMNYIYIYTYTVNWSYYIIFNNDQWSIVVYMCWHWQCSIILQNNKGMLQLSTFVPQQPWRMGCTNQVYGHSRATKEHFLKPPEIMTTINHDHQPLPHYQAWSRLW